ncbi:MAG: hypothetical protein ACHQNT_05250 [Bacteroidia bacterium]
MKNIKLILTAVAAFCTVNFAWAHGPNLHINTRWKECSFQIDPSLTQEAWHQFAHEAGLVTYFRSLTDAKPLGAGRFEFSVLQWNTRIDETDDTWNNTFVHPHSEHWLIGGEELPFPGLMLRAGVSRKVDVAAYWTIRPGANYGVAGAQVQYNIINDTVKNWAVSTRASVNSLYGPSDLNLYVSGVDLLASKKFAVVSDWAFISPYAGISSYASWAHEKTDAVNLKDEYVSGTQGMVGAVAQIYMVRIGAEYNFSKVNSFSYKLGVNFKF